MAGGCVISPEPSGRGAWRRHAWLFPTALGIIVIVFLCWGAWRYGYDPHWLTHSHAWYRVALQPDQSRTLVATLALWLAGLSCYWWPRTAPPYACVGPPPLALQLGQMDGLEIVARAEHTRWYRRQVAFGMSNELAVPWPDLSAGRQEAAREQSRTQIAQLEDVGFAPIVPVGGPADASSFERIGMVAAKRLSAPLRWAIRSGEQMWGDVGDWRVIDDRGQLRTVTDPEFQASHEPAGDGQWRRVGTFRAWRASERLVIRTKEGRSTADRGDWVVEGQSGERWPVKEGQFQRTYRPIKAAPDAGLRDRPGRTE
jgi:hypothetical protein